MFLRHLYCFFTGHILPNWFNLAQNNTNKIIWSVVETVHNKIHREKIKLAESDQTGKINGRQKVTKICVVTKVFAGFYLCRLFFYRLTFLPTIINADFFLPIRYPWLNTETLVGSEGWKAKSASPIPFLFSTLTRCSLCKKLAAFASQTSTINFFLFSMVHFFKSSEIFSPLTPVRGIRR